MNIKYIFVLAILFFVLGIYSYFRKEPMNFWSGQRIERTQIVNVKRYNILNSIMWFSSFVYFLIVTYFEYSGNIDYAYLMIHLFIKYGIIVMVAYYMVIRYLFKK